MNVRGILIEGQDGQEYLIGFGRQPTGQLSGPPQIVSALSRRVRQGAIPPVAARRVQRAILGRLDEGFYQRVELTRDVHRRAEHFLLSLSETPLRAADALHLALAASARAASIASFDARLLSAAGAIGLALCPP